MFLYVNNELTERNRENDTIYNCNKKKISRNNLTKDAKDLNNTTYTTLLKEMKDINK